MPGKSDVNNFEKLEYDPFSDVWLRQNLKEFGSGFPTGRQE